MSERFGAVQLHPPPVYVVVVRWTCVLGPAGDVGDVRRLHFKVGGLDDPLLAMPIRHLQRLRQVVEDSFGDLGFIGTFHFKLEFSVLTLSDMTLELSDGLLILVELFLGLPYFFGGSGPMFLSSWSWLSLRGSSGLD